MTVEVSCAGAKHAVLLRRGKLVLVDHSAVAEAAVAALGGAPPPCFEILRSWRARAAWERALEPRGPGFHQLYRRPPLPSPLAGPLELGVARGWERRTARGDHEAARLLHAAIRSRAEAALRSAFAAALAGAGADRARVDRCDVVVSNLSTPSVSGRIAADEAALTVRLTGDWYRTVGQRRRSTLDGAFVVRWERDFVTVVAWEERMAGRRTAVLRRVPAPMLAGA